MRLTPSLLTLSLLLAAPALAASGGFVPLIPARTTLPYPLPAGFRLVDPRPSPTGRPAELQPERRFALLLETSAGRLVIELDTVKQPRMSAAVAGTVLDGRLGGLSFGEVRPRDTARLNRPLPLPPAAGRAASLPTPPDAPGLLLGLADPEGLHLLLTLGPAPTVPPGALAFGRVIDGAAVLARLMPGTTISRASLVVSAP